MKYVAGILCVVGLVVLVASFGWWLLHRGKVVDDVEILKSSRVAFGSLDVAVREADRRGKPLGPYELGPGDNPVRLAARVDTSFLKRSTTFTRMQVHAAMLDESGRSVWSGECRIHTSTRRKKSKGGKSRPVIEIKESTFGPITVEKPGRYTFRCSVESLPEGWAKRHASEFDVRLILRKNAQPLPLLYVLIGLALVVVGAVVAKVSGAGAKRPTDEPAA